jgi:hypothetical protein
VTPPGETSLPAVREGARRVLEQAWDADAGYCVPNAVTYPHLWLWDSCFHSLGWMGVRDTRAVDELAAVFVAQTRDGFVPHMRYRRQPDYLRGPRTDASCLTQPPVYGIVVERLVAAGHAVPSAVVDAAVRGLRHLWRTRQATPGLLAVYHPWESGADDSPRWDDWVGTSSWTLAAFRAADQALLRDVEFAGVEAVGSRSFTSCPAAFNAIIACSCARLASALDDAELRAIADRSGDAIDAVLWNDREGLWNDLPVVGGAEAQTWPTLDGVLGALATNDAAKAHRALDQLLMPDRFHAPYGLRYLPKDHPAYDGDAYWRGPAWPQLDYLAWCAARRWGRIDVARAIEDMARRGVIASSFAEYWNPDTGHGLGAIPQTWAAVVVAMDDELAPPRCD